MPSLQTARRVANAKNNGAKTIGQIYKEESLRKRHPYEDLLDT